MKRENEARTRRAACVAGGDAYGTKLVGDPSGYPGEKLSFDPTLTVLAVARKSQVRPH